VPACEFGCLLGALFGFVLSRGTQKEAVKRQIASLPQKRQEQVPGPRDLALAQPCPRAQNAPTRPPLLAPPQVHALLGGLTTRRAGLLLFASMRMTPLLTFGWVNGIAGALTDVPVALFALASMMGTPPRPEKRAPRLAGPVMARGPCRPCDARSPAPPEPAGRSMPVSSRRHLRPRFPFCAAAGVQMDICTRIYVGNTLRLATDAAEGSGGGNATADGGGNHTGAGAGAGVEDPARIPLLIVQICMLLIVLIVPTVVGNRILKRMLAERAQAEAQAAAPASVDMTPTRASGPVAVATPPSSAAPAPASGTSDPRV
jgi:hypothetical protein